jgi:threonine dehydrogenase-like Zn-dependent dehydrogenase
LETDRPSALREAIMACRKGGTLSVPGVYGGLIDKIPFGAPLAYEAFRDKEDDCIKVVMTP